ncbi:DUF6233 domain-containing protein [Streptomyces sp. NPDC060028]|uniref:DUF6233 domain-containing protein n=1 Tax=Streptomyces sp. NPDC060028 TaxID=3347041 RepID=UPI0036960A4D
MVTYLRAELDRAERALSSAEEREALAARRALAEQVPACPHCRPDVALGVLE